MLGRPLSEVLKREVVSQKYLAYDSNTPQSTLSDHVKGKQPVDITKAADYAESLNDSKFSLEVAYLFFGTISAMTGDKYQSNPLALDILQQKESNERKAKKDLALEILTLKNGKFDQSDKDTLFDYASEYLDEIMVETTMLVSLLDICDKTLMEAVNARMPYWQEKGYMRKE